MVALDPGLEERHVRRTHQWILRDGARGEPLRGGSPTRGDGRAARPRSVRHEKGNLHVRPCVGPPGRAGHGPPRSRPRVHPRRSPGGLTRSYPARRRELPAPDPVAVRPGSSADEASRDDGEGAVSSGADRTSPGQPSAGGEPSAAASRLRAGRRRGRGVVGGTPVVPASPAGIPGGPEP